MDDVACALVTLQTLRDVGLRWSVDDFGTSQ